MYTTKKFCVFVFGTSIHITQRRRSSLASTLSTRKQPAPSFHELSTNDGACCAQYMLAVVAAARRAGEGDEVSAGALITEP